MLFYGMGTFLIYTKYMFCVLQLKREVKKKYNYFSELRVVSRCPVMRVFCRLALPFWLCDGVFLCDGYFVVMLVIS